MKSLIQTVSGFFFGLSGALQQETNLTGREKKSSGGDKQQQVSPAKIIRSVFRRPKAREPVKHVNCFISIQKRFRILLNAALLPENSYLPMPAKEKP
jgi:hypothetical protein